MDRREFLGSAAALPAIRADSQQKQTVQECVILEVLGRQEFAGVMTDATIGGCPFFRLDIPERDGRSYKETKYFSPNAIYAFRIVDQTTMMAHHSITPVHFRHEGRFYDSFQDGRLEPHEPNNGW